MPGNKKHNIPAVPRALLKIMSLYYKKHSIVEDCEETFSEIMKSEGSFKAKCWYWGSTLKSVAGYLKLMVS